jgi:hypothetical protein
MTKRELIDEIVTRNPTAKPAFLARFEEADLDEYLDHLIVAREPRLRGDPHRYDKYFVSDGQPAAAQEAQVTAPVPPPAQVLAPAQTRRPSAARDWAVRPPQPSKPVTTGLFAPDRSQEGLPQHEGTDNQPAAEMLFRNAYQPEVQPFAQTNQDDDPDTEELQRPAGPEDSYTDDAPTPTVSEAEPPAASIVEPTTASEVEPGLNEVQPAAVSEIEPSSEIEPELHDKPAQPQEDPEPAPEPIETMFEPSPPPRRYEPVDIEETVSVGVADADADRNKDNNDSWLF